MQNQSLAGIRKGTDVLGSEGDKVGEVERVHNSYFVVQEGFFFPTEQYIPASAVSHIDNDGVHLNVTKETAQFQGWDIEPGHDAWSVIADDTTPPQAEQFELGTTGEYRRGEAGNVEEKEKRTFSPTDADPTPRSN